MLGQQIERDNIPTPDYPTFLQNSLVKEEQDEGALDWFRGEAMDEKSQLIYLCSE